MPVKVKLSSRFHAGFMDVMPVVPATPTARAVPWTPLRAWQTIRSRAHRYAETIYERHRNASLRGRRMPRTPLLRMWPPFRENVAVVFVSVVLVHVAPPAFDFNAHMPAAFQVVDGDTPLQRAAAALAFACVFVLAFLANFIAYYLCYTRMYRGAMHVLVTSWIGPSIGVPTALLLLRCADAASVPLDSLTLILATWNIALPAVVFLQWPMTTERSVLGTNYHSNFERFGVARRVYSALLAILCTWMLACVPYITLIAMLGARCSLSLSHKASCGQTAAPYACSATLIARLRVPPTRSSRRARPAACRAAMLLACPASRHRRPATQASALTLIPSLS